MSCLYRSDCRSAQWNSEQVMMHLRGLTLEHFQNLRPFLYHLTDRENLARIRRSSKLTPAALLIADSGRKDLLRVRRRNHEVITIGKDVIRVRDQAPLHQGNVTFPSGYTLGDFIENLNSRVF